MAQVQIACFVEEEHAALAVRFLRRHGVKASARTMYFRRKVNNSHPVFADESEWVRAETLFRKVLAGEYANDDPAGSSGRALGAALAQAVLPAGGFERPKTLSLVAPFLVLTGVPVVLVFGPLAVRFLLSLWP